MLGSTTIDRMRAALRQYRVDQPDDYTFALYGPDNFCERHDSYAAAYERKEELGLLAAIEAMHPLPTALIDAGAAGLDGDRIGQVMHAAADAIAAEYHASRRAEE